MHGFSTWSLCGGSFTSKHILNFGGLKRTKSTVFLKHLRNVLRTSFIATVEWEANENFYPVLLVSIVCVTTALVIQSKGPENKTKEVVSHEKQARDWIDCWTTCLERRNKRRGNWIFSSLRHQRIAEEHTYRDSRIVDQPLHSPMEGRLCSQNRSADLFEGTRLPWGGTETLVHPFLYCVENILPNNGRHR